MAVTRICTDRSNRADCPTPSRLSKDNSTPLLDGNGNKIRQTYLLGSTMNKKKTKEELKKMINLPEMFYQPDNDKIWMKDGRRRYVPHRKVRSSLDLSMSMSYPRKESAELFAKTYKDHSQDLGDP